MIALSWKYNKAHIWLDALPEWMLGETQVVEYAHEAAGMKYTAVRSSAIELFIPTGGRAYYGALGANFVPSVGTKLVVQIPSSLNEGKIMTDALAGRFDTVYTGLPQEYFPGIIDGMMHTAEIQSLGTGTLSFCRAAHGSLGSSIKFFDILATLVIKLLLLDRQAVSENGLLMLIQTELTKQGMKYP